MNLPYGILGIFPVDELTFGSTKLIVGDPIDWQNLLCPPQSCVMDMYVWVACLENSTALTFNPSPALCQNESYKSKAFATKRQA